MFIPSKHYFIDVSIPIMAILCHSAASSFARFGAVVDARNPGQILAKRFNQLNPMYMRRIMGNLCH